MNKAIKFINVRTPNEIELIEVYKQDLISHGLNPLDKKVRKSYTDAITSNGYDQTQAESLYKDIINQINKRDED